MSRGKMKAGYSDTGNLSDFFSNGEYRNVIGKPILKEISEELKNPNTGSVNYVGLLKKWKYLRVKAKRTEKFGREFPDSVIDAGLDIYEGLMKECARAIASGKLDYSELRTAIKGSGYLLKEHSDLLLFKQLKKRPRDNIELHHKKMDMLQVDMLVSSTRMGAISSSIIEKIEGMQDGG